MNSFCKNISIWMISPLTSINRKLSTSSVVSINSSGSQKNTTNGTIPINNIRRPPILQNITSISNAQQSTSSGDSKTTFSEEEVQKFRNLASEWWKRDGEFKALHTMNKLRIALIREGLITTGVMNIAFQDGPRPLQGLRILDVGCGGGILSEPLARLGAVVTGLDAAEEGIEAAKLHAVKDSKLDNNPNYICDRIEDHMYTLDQPYDAIVASEVLEHVSSVDCFLDACSAGVRPNGSLFVTTLNRSVESYLGAIVAAEYVMNIVPKGTHDWNKFLQPQELIDKMQQRSFGLKLVHGMHYCPPTNSWHWSKNQSINYAVHAVKTEQ